MDWFRMYGEMMDDPKIGTLTDAEFRTWVELLCTACKAEDDGNTHLTEADINWALRRNATETLQKLLNRDLVTINDAGQIVICSWEKRQKKSDSSTERVRAYREKSKQDKALDESNATESLKKQTLSGLEVRREEMRRDECNNPNGLFDASDAGDGHESCPHKKIIALYHEVLPMCPRIKDWTPSRAVQLRARWNEDKKRQTLDWWREFFGYVGTCPFLVGHGSGKEPFFADLEWLVKARNFVKVREGKYEARGAA